MTAVQWMGILPHLILMGTSIAIMMVLCFYRNLLLTTVLTIVGLLGALFTICAVEPGSLPLQVSELLIVDTFSQFFIRLLLGASMAVTLLSYNYFSALKNGKGDEGEERPEEFYILLLISILGAVVMTGAQHFVSFFLGLELLSIPLYAMVAYYRERDKSLEAGLKYLVLAGVTGAFLLFGMAIIYGAIGSMHFPTIASKLSTLNASLLPLMLLGATLIIVSVGFKLSAAPFHMWAPDIYEGAPAHVSAYFATISKGGMLALFIRFFLSTGAVHTQAITSIITVIAVASMFMGNLLALRQKNIKRLLAYSSTAHMGYILTALVVGGASGANIEAIMFYIVAYFATSLASFGIITSLTSKGKELESIDEYQGLFWVHPGLACVFMAALFSLIGIPLTAGFIGKYLIVASGVQANQWPLMGVLLLNSFIGLYYYLRVTVSLFHKVHHGEVQEEGGKALVEQRHCVRLLDGLVLTSLFITLLWIGICPSALMDLIHSSVLKMTS